MSAYVSQSA